MISCLYSYPMFYALAIRPICRATYLTFQQKTPYPYDKVGVQFFAIPCQHRFVDS